MPERIPVWLDTDIGSDIDDAVCLAYLLRQPRCELVGISTVTGEPEQRARLASALCRAAGRDDIPIHSGSPEPLFVPQRQRRAPQAEVLPRWPHRQEFEPCTAVEALRHVIRQRPGEILLLSIGPLTNVGLLFALDPEVPSLLRGLVSMAGIFKVASLERPTEWNAAGDPHATALALRGRPPFHRLVGLDVTLRCQMPAAECERRFAALGGPYRVVLDMARVWFRSNDRITFHDPLAAAVIFEPNLCRWEAGTAEVELLSERVKGMLHWTPREEGPHRIAVEVNVERFFAHYFEVAQGPA
jgi:inosine-uridine nucleoside N-ribohydrolase